MTVSNITMSKELDLYREVRSALLAEELVDDLFISCGTLLGVIRGDGTIHLDDDFDSSYVSRHVNDPAACANELMRIGITLNKYGFDAHVSGALKSHLHVHRNSEYGTRIDVFMWYTDESSKLRVPAGVATDDGDYLYSGSRWDEEAGFSIPDRPEELLAFHYGDDWKTPRTGDDWVWWKEFQRVWKAARLSDDQVHEVEISRATPGHLRPSCEK